MLSMTPISLRDLTKRFGPTVAVEHVDLDVGAGQLFFLLGPSGCGKTTLLRMLAGFTDPTAGTICFGDRDVTQVPANKRGCGMVFQNYALWPHMTVRQNVAFGLDVRKVNAGQKANRVAEALRTVQMLPYADRKPNQLSGGQQQRVALARALVIEPTVLLLDEPLSNLDARLRLDLRGQIKQICKQAGITAVYVTHDQKEALSMADAIAVLDRGKVAQVGAPRELYDRPCNRFVAEFLGETNFVSAEIVGRENQHVVLRCLGGQFRAGVYPADLPVTGNVTCSIRPEAIQLVGADQMKTHSVYGFAGRRINAVYLGEMAQYELVIGESMTLNAFELNPRGLGDPNQFVRVTFDPDDVVILQD